MRQSDYHLAFSSLPGWYKMSELRYGRGKIRMNQTAFVRHYKDTAMEAYMRQGEERAHALGNRGPIKLDSGGRLTRDILDAYWQCGFYIFEGVVGASELRDIEADLFDILDRLPTHKGSLFDAKGRPALGADCAAPTMFWSKPLGDPFGATEAANGRHPVKMPEPMVAQNTPEEIVYLILGSLQFSDAALRVYGHPDLLRVAASINGDDFTPFNEAMFIKEPGLGASVAWHRDGVTHWDAPDWDQGTHGYNTMAQLYGCSAANGGWVVPGSHKLNKVDIAGMVKVAGTPRLPDAIPMICKPGDVAICNRQAIHGSFANTSDKWRVTVNFGFHRRKSVLNVQGGGLHNAPSIYDAERIRKRSEMIGYAIEARKQRFPDEPPFEYAPHKQSGETFEWTPQTKTKLKDYNLLDLSI